MDLNEFLRELGGAPLGGGQKAGRNQSGSGRLTEGGGGFDVCQLVSELISGATSRENPGASRLFEETMRLMGGGETGGIESGSGAATPSNSTKDYFANVELHLGPRVSANADDWSRWTCVYPQYLDSDLSVKQGRRVSRDLAVAHPMCQEIAQAGDRLGIRWIFENHGYARDLNTRGRIRFDLIDQITGRPKSLEAPNKTLLLQRLCLEILLIREESDQDLAEAMCKSSGIRQL